MVPARWQPVLDEARPLGERFANAGHRLYLVGGVVRDMLSDRAVDVPDLDFTTDALPAEIRAVLDGWAQHLWTQGERFGTIGARRDGRSVEVTTHRAEAYVPESRKPHVAFSRSIDADLSRRDFTVNAMAIDVQLAEPLLIDPFGGREDLERRRLRTPLDAAGAFSDDPLRMLRAARFIAGHGLEPVPELVDAATAMVERLRIVSVERIRDELDKLLLVADPTAGIDHLRRTGALGVVLPDLAALDDASAARCVAAVVAARRVDGRADLSVRLAALWGGSPPTLVRRRMRELRYANQVADRVVALVELLPRVVETADRSDAEVRRLAHAAGDLIGPLLDLADATVRADDGGDDGGARAVCELRDRWAVLGAVEDLSVLRAPLDGAQVATQLGIEPGPDVGAALAHLLSLRLEHGPMTEAAARDALDQWWSRRGPERPR